MPTIPFFGSFFSSSSQKMSYQVQKSEEEWRAVLNKGKFF
jgi:peptide-methionine (R)-S-oxide reductase